MKWYGLTGGLASGKSTVASLLREKGIPVLDADELARLAVQPGTEPWSKVHDYFGPSFFKPSGELDRKKLAQRVFNHPEDLRKLESWIHPWVQSEVQLQKRRWQDQGHRFAFYDVPLLFEKSLEAQFDCIVVVTCSLDKQIERAQPRSGLSKQEVLDRIRNQVPIEDKLKKAHHVLWNDGTLEELRDQVEQLVQKL